MFVIKAPTRINYFLLLLDPVLTVQTKKYSLTSDDVLHNAGFVIIAVFASWARKTVVCLICLHIIAHKSYMKIITVLPLTSLFLFPPFTDFWMSPLAYFLTASFVLKLGSADLFWMNKSTLKFIFAVAPIKVFTLLFFTFAFHNVIFSRSSFDFVIFHL